MLSSSTIEILNKLSSISDSLYPEGGLLYKYTFGHRCAHTDLSKVKGLVAENVDETLAFFISSAVSKPYSDVVSTSVRREGSLLLSSLAKDFNGFPGPRLYIEEQDISKAATLIYSASNDYHVLELFWSID